MKNILFGIILLSLFGCNDSKNKAEKQEYILVDAKVKVYHDDGTRSYKDYQPFETRTVELLAGYTPPKQPVKRSKYGGWAEKQEKATGFFHVKKIGDRWWGIDPDGYRYINVALNSINMGRSERNKKALKSKFGTS
jgi:hypothetical protein